MIELEPIGPRERLKPGESASFTEDWWLLSHPFPKQGQRLDLKALAEQVSKQTTGTKQSRGSRQSGKSTVKSCGLLRASATSMN
jgi:hypothetical protein